MSVASGGYTRESGLLSSKPAASNRIAKATAELGQVCNTISTQNMKLAKIAQLKPSLKNLKDNVLFHKMIEDDLESELASTRMQNTPLTNSFNDVGAEVFD